MVWVSVLWWFNLIPTWTLGYFLGHMPCYCMPWMLLIRSIVSSYGMRLNTMVFQQNTSIYSKLSLGRQRQDRSQPFSLGCNWPNKVRPAHSGRLLLHLICAVTPHKCPIVGLGCEADRTIHTQLISYGCEVWNITQIQNGRLETFHQYCLRRILRVRCFHRVRNEDDLESRKSINIRSCWHNRN
jgi:hypothetical protein